MNTPYWIKQDRKQKDEEKDEEKDVTIPYWISNRKSNNGFDYIVTRTIDHISSFCFPPELADKTISLQYKQFRTQRKDINELVVENIKLYSLSNAEIEKYLEAIKHILGENEIDKIDQINKINIDKLEINIDLGGFSLELAKLLGSDFLKGNYIIVSVKQKECDTLRNYTSFDSQIRTVFDSHNLDQLLLGESLIGSHKSDIRWITKNPDSIFNIEIDFDTPTGAISKLKKIKDCEKRLLSNTDLIKNRKFLDDLYGDIEQIISKHGSTDRLDIEEINIRTKIDSCKFSFYSDKENMDMYCLKGKIPIFIYFSDDDTKYGEIKDSEIKDIRRDDFLLLNGLNEKTIDILISEGIVGYSPYLGLERAANMIIRKRREVLNQFLDKNPESSEDVRKLFLEKVCEDIPEKAKELLIAVKKIKDGCDIPEIDNIAIYMTFPLVQNKILYELLSRMENVNIKSAYINTEKFIDKVSKMDDDELKIFLRTLLESLEFREEYNLVANAWLKENRKEICEEIGIKFNEKRMDDVAERITQK